MADPNPQDLPGQPIYGGYLEADPDARPARLTPVTGGATRRRSPKAKPYPKSWNGDVDTYDLSDPLYDENGWYTAARGNDKASRSIHLRLPEYAAEALDQLTAAKYFPAVKTREDFIRSAIVHELHRRIGEVRDTDFTVEVSAHTDLATICALRSEFEAKKAFVLYCKEELGEVDGNPSMVRKILDQVWAAMDGGQYDGKLFAELQAMSKKYWDDRQLSHKPKPVE